MIRPGLLAAALALLPLAGFPGVAAAQAAVAACAGDADEFVELAPHLDDQTGVATGDELRASADRWPLVATGYTYAAERVEKNDTSGPWKRLLVVADGLEVCFSGDPARTGGEMVKMKADFDGLFPPSRRKALLEQARKG